MKYISFVALFIAALLCYFTIESNATINFSEADLKFLKDCKIDLEDAKMISQLSKYEQRKLTSLINNMDCNGLEDFKVTRSYIKNWPTLFNIDFLTVKEQNDITSRGGHIGLINYLDQHSGSLISILTLALVLITIVYVLATWLILHQNKRQVKLLANQIEHNSYNAFEATVLQVDTEFIRHSELRPYFYDGIDINQDHKLYNKACSMAESLIDFFDHIITVIEMNAPDGETSSSKHEHWSQQFWSKWIVEMFSKSPILIKYFDSKSDWYPGGTLVKLHEQGKEKMKALQHSVSQKA
jgi:hypothetical protein